MTDTTTARPMRPTHHDDDPPVRGIGHLRHPVVSGGLIGVIGGGAFLFGGIAGLPAEHQGTLRGVAISLISFTLVVVLLRWISRRGWVKLPVRRLPSERPK